MTWQDTGHLSYACPKNILGERDPPPKKEKKKKRKAQQPEHVYVYIVNFMILHETTCIPTFNSFIISVIVKMKRKVKKEERTQH